MRRVRFAAGHSPWLCGALVDARTSRMYQGFMPNEPIAPEPLWTINEVSAFARVSRTYIYRLVQAGRLPAVRVSRLVRFRAEDVHRVFSPKTQAASKP